jgi:hypothetical protein
MSKVFWNLAKDKPDADITVIVHMDDGSVDVGFWDGDCWRYVSADPIDISVLHWADFPEPPK